MKYNLKEGLKNLILIKFRILNLEEGIIHNIGIKYQSISSNTFAIHRNFVSTDATKNIFINLVKLLSIRVTKSAAAYFCTQISSSCAFLTYSILILFTE